MSDTQPSANAAPILRLSDVTALTGRSRSSIYEDLAAGRLPRPIKLGPRAVGWLRRDIDAWLAERITVRDAAVTHGGQIDSRA